MCTGHVKPRQPHVHDDRQPEVVGRALRTALLIRLGVSRLAQLAGRLPSEPRRPVNANPNVGAVKLIEAFCGTSPETGWLSVTAVGVLPATVVPAAILPPLTSIPAMTPVVEMKGRADPEGVSALVVRESGAGTGVSQVEISESCNSSLR